MKKIDTKRILNIELRLGLTFNSSIDDPEYIKMIDYLYSLNDVELHKMFDKIESEDFDISHYLN